MPKTDTGQLVAALLAEFDDLAKREFITAQVRRDAEHDWLIRAMRCTLLVEAKRQHELEAMHEFFENLAPELTEEKRT